MVYKVIGIAGGVLSDGLSLIYVHFQETGAKWSSEIQMSSLEPYPPDWNERLSGSASLSITDYQLLDLELGEWMALKVNQFIELHSLYHKVHLIAAEGYTSFHLPDLRITSQLGCGATIAAVTGLPVVSDLRRMDMGFGGQGDPLVSIFEKLMPEEMNILLSLNESSQKALVTALMGVLRWREEYNVVAAATGAKRDSIGGALWLGGEA